jgi:hypothetical protein
MPLPFLAAVVAQVATTAPVTVEIRARLARDSIAGRALYRLARSLIGSDGKIRLTTRLDGGRRIAITAAGDSAARTIDMDDPDSAGIVAIPVPRGTGPAVVQVDFATPLDTAERSGYRLVESTSPESAWYPSLAGLPDSARRFQSFETSLEVPRGIALLASGVLVDSVLSEEGVQYRFRARDVEGVALAFGSGVRVASVERDGLRVRALASPEELERFRRIAAAALDAMAWYRGTLGFFPTDEIGVVPGYGGARGGFPLPGLFMIHRGDLSPDFVRWITAHELAHYYWGLHVLDASERLGWLTLALGIWTDQLYLARTADRTVPAQWRDAAADDAYARFAEAMIAGYDQRLGLPPAVADSLPYDYNSLVRHGKAATGVALLAQRLGTDRFVSVLKDLLSRYRHQPLSVEAFGAALEAAGLQDANAFLAQWARGDARIGYRVRPPRALPGGKVRVGLERTGTVTYPVTVAVRSAGRTVRHDFSGAARVDSADLALGGPVQGVLLDPDGLIPMPTSDNREMRRVFLRAESAALEPHRFVPRARAALRTDPDPRIGALLIQSLAALGRPAEVVAAAQANPTFVECRDRVRCLAALEVTSALQKLGKSVGAQAWLRNLEGSMASIGLERTRRLAEVRREVTGASAPR